MENGIEKASTVAALAIPAAEIQIGQRIPKPGVHLGYTLPSFQLPLQHQPKSRLDGQLSRLTLPAAVGWVGSCQYSTASKQQPWAHPPGFPSCTRAGCAQPTVLRV
eukprot:1157775-Pelagomonas_calceolata.AAC.2